MLTIYETESILALEGLQLYLTQQVKAWLDVRREGFQMEAFNIPIIIALINRLTDSYELCLSVPTANLLVRIEEAHEVNDKADTDIEQAYEMALELFAAESGQKWEHVQDSAPESAL